MGSTISNYKIILESEGIPLGTAIIITAAGLSTQPPIGKRRVML